MPAGAPLSWAMAATLVARGPSRSARVRAASRMSSLSCLRGEVRPAQLLSLRGRHRLSRYRLDFELDAAGPTRSHVWARTWADFPGPAGAAYRALVISSGAHARIVRRILRRIADTANTATSVSP